MKTIDGHKLVHHFIRNWSGFIEYVYEFNEKKDQQHPYGVLVFNDDIVVEARTTFIGGIIIDNSELESIKENIRQLAVIVIFERKL